MDNYIEFKKKRNLEEILSDSFSFMQIEYKSILQVVLKTNLYLLVIAVAIFAALDYYANNSSLSEIVLKVLTSGFLSIIFYTFLISTFYYYIQNYIENKGKIDVLQIKKSVFKNIVNILSIAFIQVVFVLIGALLFIFPGIYISVPLSLSIAVYIFTKSPIRDAILESFNLVKAQWVHAFLVLFVINLILGAISSSTTLVTAFISKFAGMGTGGANLDSNGTLTGLYMGFFTSIGSTIRVIKWIAFALFNAIATAFLFFDLHEKKYQTGTIEQIDDLGN